MSNARLQARAEAAYLRHPDEDYDGDDYPCEECSGQGHEVDEDTGSTTKCRPCDGSGQMSIEKIRQKHQDDKDYADECRFEQQRDER